MYITAQGPRLRNDVNCVEWDAKLYYTIPYHVCDTRHRTHPNTKIEVRIGEMPSRSKDIADFPPALSGLVSQLLVSETRSRLTSESHLLIDIQEKKTEDVLVL